MPPKATGNNDHGADLQRIDSFQYPSAHVGHLSEGQQGALNKFKDISAKKGYYTAAANGQEASHDDETLLRYLRARKFIPNDAFVQFKDTEDWRKENQLDKLYETIDIEEYEQTRRLYPQWTGRRDKRGIPVYVFEVGGLNAKAVAANDTAGKARAITSKVPPKMLRLFALYENLCRFVLPLCSAIPDRPHTETPISQSNNIVDISHVGLKQFWNLKAHMQDASTLATAHYPETLDRIFIIGAPSFFPTVWGWIKRWFDPITVSKIFILSNADMKKTLEQYIEPQNIPKKYGGQLDFKFGNLPILEPIIENNLEWRTPAEQNGHRTFPTGPVKWQYDEKGDLVAVAVGSQKGQQRKTVIARLHPDAHAAKLALSPGQMANPREAFYRTTTGYSTHPPSPPDHVIDRQPSTSSESGSAEIPAAAVPMTSRAGTFTVPYRDNDGPTPATMEPRQGTSSTRFEQQSATHASGQLADGTPALRDNAEGDKHAVMDPHTVGQAPKEHPLPTPEEPAPSYVDQAKDVAGQAYEKGVELQQSVLSAVGYGGKEEPKVAEPATKEDPAVDGMASKGVEEFLRSQNLSQGAADKATAAGQE